MQAPFSGTEALLFPQARFSLRTLPERVSLTTSAPSPVRSSAAEAYLTGKKAAEVDLEELGNLTAGDASPRTSWRSSAEFRIALIKELVGRAYGTALARAKEN